MKKIYFSAFLILLNFFGNSQTSVSWSPPATVASGYSNLYPRLTLTSGDKPLVVWENSSTGKIYRSKWSGMAFSTPIPVHNSGVTPFIADWAGAEVAASGDTAFVVFSTQPAMTGKVYSVRSINGGATFSDTVQVDKILSDLPRFPAVSVKPGGNPVINFMTIDSISMENAEYAVAHSFDGGSSYTSTSIPSLNAPGTVCDCCPASMAINGNKEALMYRNNISNIRNMWASFSIDAGATFPVSAEIDQSNWMIMSCPSSGPSGIISDDSLISTWMSDATGDARIYLGTINILDQQMGFNKQLYPIGTTTQNFPIMAGNADTIGIVWQGYNGGLQDILFTYSVTGASGLGIKIDTLTKGTNGNQSRPDLDYKNGIFHIVYSDSNGGNVKYIKGAISSVTGISGRTENIHFNNSFFQDGYIVVELNSNENSEASFDIMNTMGQKISSSLLQINKGRNLFNLPGNMINGIYYINITTSENTMYGRKILIIK